LAKAATGGKKCRRGLLRLERKPKLLGEAAGIAIFLAMGTPYDAIALLDELERRVRKLAADIGSSPGQIMIQAIEEYVADMEDGQIAGTRLKALDAGDSSTVSLETLLGEYGMAN
jgi:predicted DNA-binding protein